MGCRTFLGFGWGTSLELGNFWSCARVGVELDDSGFGARVGFGVDTFHRVWWVEPCL
jgi:nitrous oxidase accessory protein NosD